MDNSAYPKATSGEEDVPEYTRQILLEHAVEMTKVWHGAAVVHDCNMFFSPISDQFTLLVLFMGTTGTTHRELLTIDDELSNNDRLQQGYEHLCNLSHLIKSSNDTEIHIGHAIFAPLHVEFLESYVSRVRPHFQLHILNVDFVNKEPSFAINEINHSVRELTGDRISKLFDRPLPRDTSIVVVHYSYMNAKWANPFDVKSTKAENFHTSSGTCTIDMMTQNAYLPYINIDDLQAEAIGLPYEGGEIYIFFILPHRKQTLNNVTVQLKSDHIQRIVQQSQNTNVNVKTPRIKMYTWSHDISDTLREVGVEEIFTENAKLHNMVKQNDSKVPASVSKILHTAEFEIHEQGTGAVAFEATSINADRDDQPSESSEPVLFHANRPFLLFVYHRPSETILFVGTVQNPNAASPFDLGTAQNPNAATQFD